jgi:uncharacterized protein with GYD domain
MPKYMFQASYTVEGTKGLLKDGGSARRTAIESLFKSAGGKLESIYYAFGEDDLYLIGDFPDAASAASISLTVGGSGAARVRTVALLTTEEIDQAVKKSVNYKPPGK